MGLAATLLAGAALRADAQRKPQQRRARRETNASRQARIQRTIEDTYSHRYEVFGGGGLLRFRPGEYLTKDNQISWAAGTTYYFSPALGVTGSAQGSFGYAETARGDNTYQVYVPKAQINEYFFMAGPTYRFYRKEKVALSGTAQAGVGWGIFGGGSKSISPALLGLWNDSTRTAFSLGLNGDYNFYPNFSFRLTPTYIGTTYGGNFQNNFGFNAGLLYRFGRQ